MSNWTQASSKVGNIKPETRSIAKELYDVAQANGHDIPIIWGIGTSKEHRTGLALDLMVRNKAAGDFLRSYIWANRARLRLRHVIWWQAITSTVNRPGVVRKMASRGNITQDHKDHLHLLFFPGSYQAPKSSPAASNGDDNLVQKIQRAVKASPVDGKWGPVTDARVMRMRNVARVHLGFPQKHSATFDIRGAQEIIGTSVDGIWGPKSQAALLSWVKSFQKILNVKADGKWGPKTDGKLVATRRRNMGKY